MEDERVADGLIVARKRSNVRGAKGPCCLQFSESQGGKGELIKAPVNCKTCEGEYASRRRPTGSAVSDQETSGLRSEVME